MTVEEVIEQCTAHELVELMVDPGWTKSRDEGCRLIAHGGIRTDNANTLLLACLYHYNSIR